MSSRHPMPGHGFAGPAAKPRHGAEDVPARAEGDSRQPWSVLVLLGVAQDDSEADAAYLADKVAGLRIFEDGKGKILGRHHSTGIGRPRFWDRARYYGEEHRLAAALDAADVSQELYA